MVAYDGRVLLVDFGIARQTHDSEADSGEDAS